MKGLPTANDIKVDVLGWAITQLSEDEVLASELRFLDGERRADLAMISATRLTAIEVKGPRDNLLTLANQISDYLTMFLDVYVAAPASYIRNVREIVPRSVGLISTNNEAVEIVRKSIPKKTLSKMSSAGWLIKKDFDAIHRTLSTSRHDDISILRAAIISRFERQALQQLALSKLRNRALARHDAFVSELGRTMTLDDVHMLTIEEKIKR